MRFGSPGEGIRVRERGDVRFENVVGVLHDGGDEQSAKGLQANNAPHSRREAGKERAYARARDGSAIGEA